MLKRILQILFGLLLFLLLMQSLRVFAQQPATPAQDKKKMETVFLCRLDALTAEERKRHQSLGALIRLSVKETKELADGYAFRLPGNKAMVMTVAEFVTLERSCCPFFTFEIELGDAEKPLWLTWRGEEGVKEFLKAQLGLK